jgi:subtilisin family serine protease
MKDKKKLRTKASVLVVGALIMLTTMTTMNTNAEEQGYHEVFANGQVIVKLDPGVTIEETGINDDYVVLETEEELNAYLLVVPVGGEDEAIQYLQGIPRVQYAERNLMVTAFLEPNDPLWDYQYGPRNINCPAAWDIELGDHSIIVSIIDTGIDMNHPDLRGNYRAFGSWNFILHNPWPWDNNGHGTHCAGIVAAEINNAIGIAGVADVQIISQKVLDRFGSGFIWTVSRGIVRSALVGADIISMSLGGYSDTPPKTLEFACEFANFMGCTLVAAAGNGGSNEIAYPAALDCVIAVGAVDSNNDRAYFSDYGEDLEVMAPGVNILSTMPTYHVTLNDEGYSQNYDNLSGTSMACPHVAGVLALYYSKNGASVDNEMAIQRLHDSSIDLGASGKDIYYGYGLVNAYGILQYDDDSMDFAIHNTVLSQREHMV